MPNLPMHPFMITSMFWHQLTGGKLTTGSTHILAKLVCNKVLLPVLLQKNHCFLTQLYIYNCLRE